MIVILYIGNKRIKNQRRKVSLSPSQKPQGYVRVLETAQKIRLNSSATIKCSLRIMVK